MRLHIQSGKDFLNVDLDMIDRDIVERSKDSESRTIRLDSNLNKDSKEALRALYALVGHEHCPAINAIEAIAREAFLAGQKMTKYT